MNINEVLKVGREILLQNNVDPREARLLLAFVLQVRKEELITIYEISENDYKKYIEIINRRVLGEPYAYIVGYKEFMKLDFKVNENVLIPREDTELLVEEVISLVKNKQNQLATNDSLITKNTVKILDMCTGSGCIAISLAKLLNNVDVTAVDVSEKTLDIAKENATINESKVSFVLSDLFENITGEYDVIASNPPYIQTKIIKELQKEVKMEPELALDGGENGLDFYEKIINRAPEFLKNKGILAFEIGYDQGEDVKNIMAEQGFKEVTIRKDLGNQDRVVIGTWNKK